MDNKQKLTDIVKNAKLPAQIETLILEDIAKQETVSDEYILDVADVMERLGLYFQTVGESQNSYLDNLALEAGKVNDAMTYLNSLADQLESSADQPQAAAPPVPAMPVVDAMSQAPAPMAPAMPQDQTMSPPPAPVMETPVAPAPMAMPEPISAAPAMPVADTTMPQAPVMPVVDAGTPPPTPSY